MRKYWYAFSDDNPYEAEYVRFEDGKMIVIGVWRLKYFNRNPL